jgi:hypothetical protein
MRRRIAFEISLHLHDAPNSPFAALFPYQQFSEQIARYLSRIAVVKTAR